MESIVANALDRLEDTSAEAKNSRRRAKFASATGIAYSLTQIPTPSSSKLPAKRKEVLRLDACTNRNDCNKAGYARQALKLDDKVTFWAFSWVCTTMGATVRQATREENGFSFGNRVRHRNAPSKAKISQSAP